MGFGISETPLDAVSDALRNLDRGVVGAQDRLVELFLPDIRKLANSQLDVASFKGETDLTSIVHETFTRLFSSKKPTAEERRRVQHATAQGIRHIMVERARAAELRAANNDAYASARVAGLRTDERLASLLRVDEALERLRDIAPHQQEMFTAWYFAGLSRAEIATTLRVSASAVDNELSLASAWLSTARPAEVPSADAHALFCDAARLPPAEREEFLRLRAESDPELAAFVSACLEQTERPSWLDEPLERFLPELFDPGDIEVGPYTIVRKLGSGSMGEVYLARDDRLDRDVALKVLSRFHSRLESHGAGLLREARAAARLDHPGIVQVFDVGHNGAACWIASALVDGGTLRERLDALDPTEIGRNAWIADAARIVHGCAVALDHAHARGVIHRDVKPPNILLDQRLEPRLVDFGISHTPGDRFETVLHHAGTTPYMSPERARESERTPHPRSDVYSLGVVLYECLTGTLPYRAKTLAQLLRAQDAGPPRGVRAMNRLVPRALEAVCLKAIEPDPTRRYQSAAEFARDLRRAMGGEAVPGLTRFARARAWAMRRRVPIAAAVGGALVAGGLVALATTLINPVPRGVFEIAGAGARATIYPIDPVTRAASEVVVHSSKLPVRERLPSGLYRAVVESAAGPLEFTREIVAGETVSVTPPSAPAWEIESDMILIPAGGATVGLTRGDDPAMVRRPIDLPAFWIDRYEVTNAEYRAYVLATGAPAPKIWPVPYDPALDHLPVVSVTRDEARAFAEWAGKRLPSDTEWERAACSPLPHRFPWGDADPPPPVDTSGSNARGLWGVLSKYTIEEAREHYVTYVKPVNATDLDITPEGGVFFFGNVAEWTESHSSAQSPVRGYLYKGTDWAHSNTAAEGLNALAFGSESTSGFHIGFRCARSAY